METRAEKDNFHIVQKVLFEHNVELFPCVVSEYGTIGMSMSIYMALNNDAALCEEIAKKEKARPSDPIFITSLQPHNYVFTWTY